MMFLVVILIWGPSCQKTSNNWSKNVQTDFYSGRQTRQTDRHTHIHTIKLTESIHITQL